MKPSAFHVCIFGAKVRKLPLRQKRVALFFSNHLGNGEIAASDEDYVVEMGIVDG